jgi:hypothetical protein
MGTAEATAVDLALIGAFATRLVGARFSQIGTTEATM